MRLTRRFMIFLSVFVLGIMSFAMRVPTTSALDSASITITSFTDFSNDCGQTSFNAGPGGSEGLQIDYFINMVGFTVDSPSSGFDADNYAIIVRDANDTIISYILTGANLGLNPVSGLPAGGTLYINQPYDSSYLPPTGQPMSRPWRFEIRDFTTYDGMGPGTSPDQRFAVLLSKPIVGVTVIDPVEFSEACEALPYIGSGEAVNLNNGVGDLEAQVFEGRDDNGEAALNVYEVNNDGDGAFAFQITQDDIAQYVTQPPADNTEILASASGKVVFYVLETGEFQINIGPDENGDVFVLIFDALPPEAIRSYTFNVYELLDD